MSPQRKEKEKKGRVNKCWRKMASLITLCGRGGETLLSLEITFGSCPSFLNDPVLLSFTPFLIVTGFCRCWRFLCMYILLLSNYAFSISCYLSSLPVPFLISHCQVSSVQITKSVLFFTCRENYPARNRGILRSVRTSNSSTTTRGIFRSIRTNNSLALENSVSKIIL